MQHYYFDPQDNEEFRHAIIKIVEDEELRDQLKILNPENVQRFSWLETAKKTISVYESVMS